jgi:hypothetical protein
MMNGAIVPRDASSVSGFSLTTSMITSSSVMTLPQITVTDILTSTYTATVKQTITVTLSRAANSTIDTSVSVVSTSSASAISSASRAATVSGPPSSIMTTNTLTDSGYLSLLPSEIANSTKAALTETSTLLMASPTATTPTSTPHTSLLVTQTDADEDSTYTLAHPGLTLYSTSVVVVGPSTATHGSTTARRTTGVPANSTTPVTSGGQRGGMHNPLAALVCFFFLLAAAAL